MPYPVDRETRDDTIEALGKAFTRAAIGLSEEVGTFRRLARVGPPGR
jgi:hypothetical protein